MPLLGKYRDKNDLDFLCYMLIVSLAAKTKDIR